MSLRGFGCLQISVRASTPLATTQCDARLNWCLSTCLTFNLVPCDLLCRGGVDQPFRQHQLSDYCSLWAAYSRAQDPMVVVFNIGCGQTRTRHTRTCATHMHITHMHCTRVAVASIESLYLSLPHVSFTSLLFFSVCVSSFTRIGAFSCLLLAKS